MQVGEGLRGAGERPARQHRGEKIGKFDFHGIKRIHSRLTGFIKKC
jgi:hypothetical protein